MNRGHTPSSNSKMMGPNVPQNPNYNAQSAIPNIKKPNISSAFGKHNPLPKK